MTCRPDGIWCFDAVATIFLKVFSNFPTSSVVIGNVVAKSLSVSLVKLSQSALAILTKVFLADFAGESLVAKDITIGRWSELSLVLTFHSQAVIIEDEAIDMSGDVPGPLVGSLVGRSSFRTPYELDASSSAMSVPLLSLMDEFQSSSCALKSPRIRESCEVIKCEIVGRYPGGHEEVGGM